MSFPRIRVRAWPDRQWRIQRGYTPLYDGGRRHFIFIDIWAFSLEAVWYS